MGRKAGLAAAVFLLSLSFLYVRFGYWLPQVWFGDDLKDYYASVDGAFVNSWPSAFSNTFANKWRPIFSLFIWFEYSHFDKLLIYYHLSNLAINALSVCIFFYVAKMLSRSLSVASGLSVLMAGSRFATYQITQVNGPVESLPVLFTLFATYCIALSEHTDRMLRDSTNKRTWLISAAILSLCLAAYTHERYLAGLAVLIPYLWVTGGLTKNLRIACTAAVFIAILFNVIVKTFLLRIDFFVGTGGQNLTFNPGATITHIMEALSSAVWFNHGPDHLIGVTTLQLPLFYVYLAAIGAAAVSLIAILGIAGAVADRSDWVLPAFILALAGALLVPGVAVFRFEQRWLYSTFVLGLLFLAWCSSYIRYRPLLNGLLVALVCSALALETRLSFAGERTFFLTRAMRIAEDARVLLDGKSGPIVLEGAEASICGWVLSSGLFFRMYQGAKRDVYCVSPEGSYPGTPPPDAERFTHSWGGFQAKRP